LSAEAGQYLLRRVTRSATALFAVLDEADGAALAAQRKLTVPFLKSVLEARD
jgi:DnaA family protein